MEAQLLSIKTIEAHVVTDKGGRWSPLECRSRDKVAILVPYRDRWDDLLIFLNNIHRFLQAQLLEYAIFIIEQVGHSCRIMLTYFWLMWYFNHWLVSYNTWHHWNQQIAPFYNMNHAPVRCLFCPIDDDDHIYLTLSCRIYQEYKLYATSYFADTRCVLTPY